MLHRAAKLKVRRAPAVVDARRDRRGCGSLRRPRRPAVRRTGPRRPGARRRHVPAGQGVRRDRLGGRGPPRRPGRPHRRGTGGRRERSVLRLAADRSSRRARALLQAAAVRPPPRPQGGGGGGGGPRGAAVAGGAELREGRRVTGVAVRPDRVVVAADGEAHEASLVIGADGTNSVVGRSVGLSHRDGPWRYASIRAEVELPPEGIAAPGAPAPAPPPN